MVAFYTVSPHPLPASPPRCCVCVVPQARRLRKVLGGGMRQAGVIAAPGIVALTEQVQKLAQDHSNAKCVVGADSCSRGELCLCRCMLSGRAVRASTLTTLPAPPNPPSALWGALSCAREGVRSACKRGGDPTYRLYCPLVVSVVVTSTLSVVMARYTFWIPGSV